eukprot:3823247-Lingulodinium_polyedra.AAC.1
MQHEALRRRALLNKRAQSRVTVPNVLEGRTFPPAVTERVSGIPAVRANGVIRQASMVQSVPSPLSTQQN